MAKYDYIALAEAKKLNEKELKALLKFLNNSQDKEHIKLVRKKLENNPLIYDGEGIALTQDQVNKGAKWLYNKGFTPKGAERKNSPYGYKEEEIVKNIVTIRLIGLYNSGAFFRDWYQPYYQVIDDNGETFDYIVSGGDIKILG